MPCDIVWLNIYKAKSYRMHSVTKLTMPRLSDNLVQRPAALEQLDAVLHTRLAVVCAPAGYGKTTLVGQWLLHSKKRYCWLSLDERDNDEGHFWRGITAAITTVLHRLIEQPSAHANAVDIEARIDLLVYELIETSRAWSAPEQLILVLDDFHAIKNPRIHKQLNRFIEDCPAFIKFIITTRFEPHLNLPARRVKHQVTELSTADLIFNLANCQALLQRQQAIKLEEDDLKTLYAKTEGWVAAIQLAGMALKHKADQSAFIASFSGNQQLLAAYLFDEVFSHQPHDIKDTLVNMSILPKFCAELIEAVTGCSDGHAFIATLQQLNMLISPLDESGKWYRLHDLFREWLFQQAVISKAIDLNELRRKAGIWLETKGMYLEALEHIFPLEEWHWASSVSGALLVDLTLTSDLAISELILDHFPQDFIKTQPKLCLLKAVVEHSKNTLTTTNHYLEVAELLLASLKDADHESARSDMGLLTTDNINEFMAFVYDFRSLIAWIQGDANLSRSLIAKVMAIPGVESYPLYANALFTQGLNYYGEKQFKHAELSFLNAIDNAKANNNPGFLLRSVQALSGIYYHLGKHYLINDLIEETEAWLTPSDYCQKNIRVLLNISKATMYIADGQAKTALALLESHDQQLRFLSPVEQIIAMFVKVLTLIYLHKHAEAMRLVDAMEIIYQRNFTHWVFPQPDINCLRAIIYLQKGNNDELLKWARQCEDRSQSICPVALEEQTSIYLLIQVMQGKDIREEAKAYRNRAEQCHEIVWQIRSWLLDVAFYGLKGKKIRAMHAFAKALKLGAAHDSTTVFLTTGESCIPLLEGAIKLRIEAKFANKVLALLKGEQHPNPHTKKASLSTVALSPLSTRELELLKLINEGYSNRQIAEVTQITEGTVKAHLSNVYSKLAVKNRTQALATAREQGILNDDNR